MNDVALGYRASTRRLWWVLWVVVSVGPVLAYASPLWNNLFADTPIADLVWIPIIALGWISWQIVTARVPAVTDRELDAILGGLLAAATAMTFVIGPARWPSFFVYDHGGLLFWPLWMLAMVWLFWGIGLTRDVAPPLIYLVLAWPPIFEGLANATQTVLVRWANDVLTLLAHHVTWLSSTVVSGTYAVLYHHAPVLVVVAQACSGADSLLGAAIVIPVIWFVFRGPWLHKALLSGVALAGALVLNWIRLALIVLAVHTLGPTITFDAIHPVLGFVLFAALAVLVVVLFRPFGLQVPLLTGRTALAQPGWIPAVAAIVIGVLAFVLLIPLFSLARGSFGNPSPIKHYDVHTFLPALPGLVQAPVYYANESSILGQGSATQADLYVNPRGVGQALLELWSTPDANALSTYGFQNCLLYHGDAIPAVTSFPLEPGVVATAYAVTLPPTRVGGPRSTYVDVEWNSAVTSRGVVEFQRWSLAAFAQSRPTVVLPPAAADVGHLSPIQAMVAPAAAGSWRPAWLQTRTELIGLARQIFLRATVPQTTSGQ
ncbi:MAG: archaeosortase/exosortase family protein [Firmicutes bacterium]|nr:archaeosortase/exosortase family protein [Bacillota bacterium]